MGIVLVYSIDDERSFSNLQEWLNLVERHAPQNTPIILVANKSDLDEQRHVRTARGESFAEHKNIPFYEVSALYGCGVVECFDRLTHLIKERVQPTITTTQRNTSQQPKTCAVVDVNTSSQKDDSCC